MAAPDKVTLFTEYRLIPCLWQRFVSPTAIGRGTSSTGTGGKCRHDAVSSAVGRFKEHSQLHAVQGD